MTASQKTQEKILNNLAKSLEILPTAQKKAEERYESIGNWLSREDSILAKYNPEFYSQGSIRLGTAIKPLNDYEEYDLDAVCLINSFCINTISQKNLKDHIGFELKLYIKANSFQKPLNEGKRCWTLEYSDSAQFHMDILPSVPDEEGFRNMLSENNISLDSINTLHTSTAISITDNTSQNYPIIHPDWNKSNPKGYHEWFKERCKITQRITKDSLSLESASANVEEIPNQKIKSPLQKAIMILKRHRDIKFQYDGEHKPISVIISTLSAKAYNGTEQLQDTLDNIIFGMEQAMTCDISGNCVVLNPVNPKENFADKWEDEPIKRDNFARWLAQLKQDYKYLVSDDFSSNKQILENSFGEKAIQSTYNDSFGVVTKLKDRAKQLLSLTHVQQPTWTMNIQYSVQITCRTNKDGMLNKQLKSGESISKWWKLRFEVHASNIGSGRKFYWQVANSGEEARNANSLRGGFYDGEISRGGKTREESTSYVGSHFVRCFVVQNNQCVAVSDPFIVNIV